MRSLVSLCSLVIFLAGCQTSNPEKNKSAEISDDQLLQETEMPGIIIESEQAVRSPAWDYEFRSGPQKAGEKRTYHLRLVYKPFESIEDILMEVNSFLSEPK
jgi:hypothetical protein